MAITIPNISTNIARASGTGNAENALRFFNALPQPTANAFDVISQGLDANAQARQAQAALQIKQQAEARAQIKDNIEIQSGALELKQQQQQDVIRTQLSDAMTTGNYGMAKNIYLSQGALLPKDEFNAAGEQLYKQTGDLDLLSFKNKQTYIKNLRATGAEATKLAGVRKSIARDLGLPEDFVADRVINKEGDGYDITFYTPEGEKIQERSSVGMVKSMLDGINKIVRLDRTNIDNEGAFSTIREDEAISQQKVRLIAKKAEQEELQEQYPTPIRQAVIEKIEFEISKLDKKREDLNLKASSPSLKANIVASQITTGNIPIEAPVSFVEDIIVPEVGDKISGETVRQFNLKSTEIPVLTSPQYIEEYQKYKSKKGKENMTYDEFIKISLIDLQSQSSAKKRK